ncbi:unnamed protein product [Choristocarpus tenellus]
MRRAVPFIALLAHCGLTQGYRIPPSILASSNRKGLLRRWSRIKESRKKDLRPRGLIEGEEKKESKDSSNMDGIWASILAGPGLFPRFSPSSNPLVDIGVSSFPTALATVATVWWVWQSFVVNSLDFQARVASAGIRSNLVQEGKIEEGGTFFVGGRAPLVDPTALRADVGSSYNPSLIVYGDRGAGKTVRLRMALQGESCVVYTKLGPSDLDNAPRALARAIVESSGASVPQGSTAVKVAEAALRRVRKAGIPPIVVLDLDERCTTGQLQNVLLACKHWGDEEKLAKFVVEVQSSQPVMGLSAFMGDMRAEGVKVRVWEKNADSLFCRFSQ